MTASVALLIHVPDVAAVRRQFHAFIIRDLNGFWITFGRDLEPTSSVVTPTVTPS